MTSRRATGFTLLEVMIALAIVAISIGALLGTITSSASNVIYLKDKTLAEWVALNRLTEIRLDDQNMPDLGKRTGNAEMGGLRWQWEEEVTELPIKGMFRVEVRARPTGEAARATSSISAPTSQTMTDSEPSGTALANANWTTTVTGVVGASRSQRNTAIAAALTVSPRQNPNNPGGQPGAPGTPGNPNAPGGPVTPGNPGNPGTPGTGKPGPPPPEPAE